MAKNSTIGRTVILGSLRATFAAANVISPELAAVGAARLFLRTRRYSLPERERAHLQAGRRVDLDSEWGPLAVWIWENRIWGEQNAPTVALLHGWEGRAAQLGAFVAPLVAAGFRVVGVDAPGHGDSPGRVSSLVTIAGALRALETRYGPFAGVVAHSAGTVAVTHALTRGLAADRLVCVAPGVDLEAYADGFSRLIGLSSEASRRMRRRIERRIGVSWDELDPRRAAANLRVPLLVIHDRTDREAPFAGGEALARSWPGARLLVTEKLGHRRILREEAVIQAATAFLCEGRLEAPVPRERLASVSL
jgi:pimeloyl-ACP methyl ester carboxylesterase